MPNNFLAPRATPKGHGAVNDAINLLASFGGGSDDLKNLLKETRDAIGHNEKLIAAAQVIVERAKDIVLKEEELATREAVVGKKWDRLEEIREGLEEHFKKYSSK